MLKLERDVFSIGLPPK